MSRTGAASAAVFALVLALSASSANCAPLPDAQKRADVASAELARLSDSGDIAAARALADQTSRDFAASGEPAFAASFALEAMKFDRDLGDWERLDREFYPR